MPSTNPSARRIRELTPVEVDAYDLIPAELVRRVKLVRIPPVLGPYDGMTLGRWVLLDRDVPADGSSRLVAHELVHVRQWSELGIVGFLVRYLGAFFRGLITERDWGTAYRGIWAEREARAEAGAWADRRSGTSPGTTS